MKWIIYDNRNDAWIGPKFRGLRGKQIGVAYMDEAQRFELDVAIRLVQRANIGLCMEPAWTMAPVEDKV